jgi:hypothetical protein
MAFNLNTFTKFQKKLLIEIRHKLIEIRDPKKEVLDNRSFEFTIAQTKKFGPLPKLKLKPYSMAIKQEIMEAAGYQPVVKKDSFNAQKCASASAFDKHWDSLMVGLIKSARRVAVFNQTFAVEGQEVSDIIECVRKCIEPEKPEGKIHNQQKTKVSEKSYIYKLKKV